MAQTIEEQRVPVTVKQLAIYFGGVIAVIITIMSTFYSLKADMTDNRKALETLQNDGKTRDEQIKTIQLQIQTIQLQIATMQAQNEYNKR